jgi:sugar lactone lactonase YvrE
MIPLRTLGVRDVSSCLALWALCACGGSQEPAPSGISGAGAATGGAPSAGAPSNSGGAGAPGGGAGGGAAGSAGAAGSSSGAGSGGVSAAGADAGEGGGDSGGGAPVGGSTGEGGAGGGSAGASGGTTGGSGGSGGGGTGGASTGGSGGGATAQRCPAGPFAMPRVVSSKTVCADFALSYTWNEGPTWVASQKAFFFTNFVARSASGGDIIKYTPAGGCEVFMRDVGCNGLAVSNDGNLLAACQQTRSVVRIDLATKQVTTVADRYMGQLLDTPNDLVQHTNGSIYFTNPTNELAGRPVGAGAATFRVDPSGVVSLLREGNCNGIALSPDEKKLYVLLSGMWDLDAQGVPSNPQTMFTSGDGMAVDCAGNVYANGSIFSPTGQNLGSWGSGTNLAFGGEDGTTVLVVGSGRALRELTMSVPGLP